MASPPRHIEDGQIALNPKEGSDVQNIQLTLAPPVAHRFARAWGLSARYGWSVAAALLIVGLAVPGAAQAGAGKSPSGPQLTISSYDDDPFVDETELEKVIATGFELGTDGRPILANDRIKIIDETLIYRESPLTGEFLPFANNPWPCALDVATGGCVQTSNADGTFKFSREDRFPLHLIERDADGRPLLDANGLQIWKPRDLHLGPTTAFEAVHNAKGVTEEWSGRVLPWGEPNGQMWINSHAFIDFNAFFAPSARMLFFGVVPYRLVPGGPIQMFEMGTSWEIAAHEAGHALLAELKPNRDFSHLGYKTWGESFSDQLAMWMSLRDPARVRSLLKETNGNLQSSNALTRIAEVFAALVGQGTGLRDAFHNLTVSTTSPEEHDRSEVLTGAVYKLFLVVYGERNRRGDVSRALRETSDVMGTFVARAADYVPENRMTLEDVGKAYLKVDKEFFGSRYRAFLVGEFTRREIFDASSLSEWLTHEATLPVLQLPTNATDQDIDALVQSNLDLLRIDRSLGLNLQAVVRDTRRAQTIVRVELTLGRGPGALPLGNHGLLVFRANGRLADYHAPLPSGTPVAALVASARKAGLDKHGAPLSIVRRPDGRFTVEARVMRDTGMKPYVEAFTLERPRGERRDIVPSVYGGAGKAALLQNAGTVLTAEDLME